MVFGGVVNIFINAAFDLVENLLSLWSVALLFFLLALWVKRGRLFEDFDGLFYETVLNIKVYILNAVFVVPVLFFFAPLYFYKFAFFESFWGWGQHSSIMVFFICVFAGDLIGYLRHRVEHSLVLWPFHALHHSDTRMSWFTLFRFHPFGRFFTYFIDTGFLLLLGMPIWAIAMNNVVRHYYGMLIHAELPWTYGVWGRVFVSPAMHRWHHVRFGRGGGCNYATVFSVFDQLFGTYYVPGVCDKPLGVRRELPMGLFYNFIFPFIDVFIKIKNIFLGIKKMTTLKER